MERNNTTKRIDYLDIAKGVGIIMIILGHNHINPYFKDWIFSFHVPLFFIVSGFFFKKTNILHTVKNGLFRLVLPYVIVCCITTLMWFDFSQEIHYNSINPFIYRLVPYNHWEVFCMWFLLSLFWGRIILSILSGFSELFCISISCLLFGCVLINEHFKIVQEHYFYIINSFGAQLFLLIGVKIREYGLLNLKLKYETFILIFILAVGFVSPVNMYVNGYPLGYMNVVISSLISIAIIIVCRKLGNSENLVAVALKRFLCYYGNYTLPILCCHSIFHNLIVTNAEFYLNQYIVGVFEVAVLSISPILLSCVPVLRNIFNIKHSLVWSR